MHVDVLRRERFEWKRAIERTTLLLLIALSLLALPDKNGNTQFTRLGVLAFTSLSELVHHSEVSTFIGEMQTLTQTQTNLHARDRQDVIRDAITTYDLTHPMTPAFWRQDTAYASDQRALILLLQSNHIRGLVDSTHREELMNVLMNELPDSMRLSYELRPLMAGTTLYRSGADDIQIVAYYETIKQELEGLATTTSETGLISESAMIMYFLDRTQGDIAEALADMAGFLKYMIRGVAPAYDTSQSTWILKHLLDQIDSDFSFNSIPDWSTLTKEKQTEIINLLGLVYHTYGIIGPLSTLSPAILAAGVSQNYAKQPSAVTLYKMRMDYQTVRRLPLILAMFNRDYAKIGS